MRPLCPKQASTFSSQRGGFLTAAFRWRTLQLARDHQPGVLQLQSWTYTDFLERRARRGRRLEAANLSASQQRARWTMHLAEHLAAKHRRSRRVSGQRRPRPSIGTAATSLQKPQATEARFATHHVTPALLCDRCTEMTGEEKVQDFDNGMCM